MGYFDHCQPKQRFNAYNSTMFPNGPTTFEYVDWDQRRFIPTIVPGAVEQCEEEEEQVIQALARVVDQIAVDVNLVKLSDDGKLTATSSNLEDDLVFLPLYCPIDMVPEEYRSGRCVSRAELVEIDRLSQCVDLVAYRSRPGSRAVFKYQFHPNQAPRTWHELNCWLRLSGHPGIVPIECIVTDYEDVPGHGTIEVVVGFTSAFIPGMTVQDNPTRLFKLKHLEQLLEVVDDLNLKFGIVHQDIAPRNLLIDSSSDRLLLFDFSCSGKLGQKGTPEDSWLMSNPGTFKFDLDGVIATVYEIITRDTEVAEQILQGADISAIQDKEWVKHPSVNLDADVTRYREVLQSWMERRSRPENLITHFTQVSNPLHWPQTWRPRMPSLGCDGQPLNEEISPVCSMSRAALMALGLRFIEWKRPAHDKIPDGFCVLGDGTLVAQKDL